MKPGRVLKVSFHANVPSVLPINTESSYPSPYWNSNTRNSISSVNPKEPISNNVSAVDKSKDISPSRIPSSSTPSAARRSTHQPTYSTPSHPGSGSHL